MTWINPIYQTPCCKRTWNPGEDARGPIFWNEYTEQVQCRICCRGFDMAPACGVEAENLDELEQVTDVATPEGFPVAFAGFDKDGGDFDRAGPPTPRAEPQWKKDRGLA